MKRFVSLLLILALASLSLLAGGCSAKEDAIVGTWRTTIDLSSTILESLGEESEDITKYMELDRLDVVVTLSFHEDNTYTLSIDEESFQKSMEKFLDFLTEAMTKYIEEMLKETGNGMTIADYEKEIGMSIEEYIAASFSESVDLDIDTETGEYTLNNKELTIDGEYVYTIELDKDTMIFVDCSYTDEFFGMFKGVVWKKD